MAICSRSPFSLQFLETTNLLSISIELPDLETEILTILLLSHLSMGWEQGTTSEVSVWVYIFLRRSLCVVDAVMEVWALKLLLPLPGSLAHRGGGVWKSHPSTWEVGVWWAAGWETSNTELLPLPPTILGAACLGHWPGLWKKQAQPRYWPQGAFSSFAAFSNI